MVTTKYQPESSLSTSERRILGTILTANNVASQLIVYRDVVSHCQVISLTLAS